MLVCMSVCTKEKKTIFIYSFKFCHRHFILISYLFTLVLCTLIIIPKGQASEKWSWGKTTNEKNSSDNKHEGVKDEGIVPRSIDGGGFTKIPVASSQNLSEKSSGGNTVKPPALSEGRSLKKFFKDMECRFGGKSKIPYSQPLYGAPVPVPGPYPIFSAPIAVAPAPQYPSPILGPGPQYPPSIIAPLPRPISLPKPAPVKVGYPPIPVVTEHHHTHTHIHKGGPIAAPISPIGSITPIAESPYKHTGYPPRPGFSPTILNGGSHQDSHESFGSPVGNNNGYGISPIAVQPEAVTGTLYRPAKSLYAEECSCVLPQYCSSYDIVRITSGKDIAHLINPRNEALSILSNATDSHEHIRGKRDAPVITNRQPVASTRTAKARAIGGYTPGLSGCAPNYVCCRNSVNQEAKQFDGVCGKSLRNAIHGRVANTEYNRGVTQFGEFPWQGAILREKDYESLFVCGATLVSQQHVLTAAHCVVDEPYQSLIVRLGDWDVNGQTEFYKHIELPVANVVIHPKFYAGNLENDIAVLTLRGYIDFLANPHISPVCLPNPYTDFTHQQCYVSGWGKRRLRVLRRISTNLEEDKAVSTLFRELDLVEDYHLPEGFICAGGEEGKDTCK
ncbi:Serine proteinase stubble, partial [Armadillidium vulgare]